MNQNARNIALELHTKVNELISALTTPQPEASDRDRIETLTDDLCDPASHLWGGETSDLDGRIEHYLDPQIVGGVLGNLCTAIRTDERRKAADRVEKWLKSPMEPKGVEELCVDMRVAVLAEVTPSSSSKEPT